MPSPLPRPRSSPVMSVQQALNIAQYLAAHPGLYGLQPGDALVDHTTRAFLGGPVNQPVNQHPNVYDHDTLLHYHHFVWPRQTTAHQGFVNPRDIFPPPVEPEVVVVNVFDNLDANDNHTDGEANSDASDADSSGDDSHKSVASASDSDSDSSDSEDDGDGAAIGPSGGKTHPARRAPISPSTTITIIAADDSESEYEITVGHHTAPHQPTGSPGSPGNQGLVNAHQPQDNQSDVEDEVDDQNLEEAIDEDDPNDLDYNPNSPGHGPRNPANYHGIEPSSPLTALPTSPQTPEVSAPRDAVVIDLTADSEPEDPNMITPDNANVPLPQVNGANVDASARAANTSSPDQQQSKEAKKVGEGLATDLYHLQVSTSTSLIDDTDIVQVRSPPLQPGSSYSIAQPALDGGPIHSGHSIPLDIPRRQESTNSSSTEGSSNHPYPPSSLSDYNAEGYPKSMMPNAQLNLEPEQQVDPLTTAAVQSQVSAADAAIMRLNGTSSVLDASSLQQPGTGGPFTLPGGFANFTNPHGRNNTAPRPAPNHPSRQLSTSTTSASTSSEEDDITQPTMVKPNALEREGAAERGPTSAKNFPEYRHYLPESIPQVTPYQPLQSNHPSRGHNGNGYVPEPAALPLGATAHSPRGVSNSVPMGIANNESSEESDDGQTVGGSSKSRSTSEEVQQPPAITKVKRKAPPADPTPSRGKTAVAAKIPDTHSKKRRRSELSDSQIDPALHDDIEDFKMETDEEDPSDASDAEVAQNSEGSWHGSPGPSRSKAKPRRAIAGRSKAANSKATIKAITKKVKSAKSPSKSENTRCTYVNPLFVSRLVFPSYSS